VSAWEAFFWGGFSSAALYIGEALAGPMKRMHRLTGQVMGFGAGTLLSAVAYELIPESSLEHGLGIGIGVLSGALVYYVADRILDETGAGERQDIAGGEVSGSGMAMFLGALLDGVPEAFILGITLALGGSINIAFVTAVFVSNIPQGIAGTTSLKAAGHSDRHIFRMWTALTIASALTAASGYILAYSAHVTGSFAEGFAGGAVLTMLADSMLPEAFQHGGKSVGLLVVLGYLVAAALSVAQ
jgi:ZIP family zinc transporter